MFRNTAPIRLSTNNTPFISSLLQSRNTNSGVVTIPIKNRESEMMPNRSGGYGFTISDEKYITRILILGTPNTYCVNAKQNTTEALDNIKRMISEGKSEMILNILTDVYENARAPKQETTFMILSVLSRSEDLETRRKTFEFVSKLRTLSQLYSFLNLYNSAGSSKGWGRLPKRYISQWISSRDAQALSYQAFKYGSREGWTLRDIMRCCHINPRDLDKELQLVLKVIVDQSFDPIKDNALLPISEYLQAIEYVKGCAKSEDEETNNKMIEHIIYLTHKFNLPREMLPTWTLNYPSVWHALLLTSDGEKVNMPFTALIRNLGSMTQKNVFTEDIIPKVVAYIMDDEIIKRSRIHPANIIVAYMTYKKGTGQRGSLMWRPVHEILDALDSAFYKSFNYLEGTGKRIYHAFDGSGSMSCAMQCLPCMSSAQAVALLGMIYAKTEDPETQTYAIFSSCSMSLYNRKSGLHYFRLDKDKKLDEVASSTQLKTWGCTDCSLPILDAKQKFENEIKKLNDKDSFYKALKDRNQAVLKTFYDKINYTGCHDVFIIYTDNDVNSGIQPSLAVKQYREATGITAKFAVIACNASRVSIADPQDEHMLDLVGFDTNVPNILKSFIDNDL